MSQTAPSYQPPDAPKKKGGFDKILIGCGIGCGMLIIVSVLAGVMGTAWFMTPGEQIATGEIAGDDSTGMVAARNIGNDPGLNSLFERTLVRMSDIQHEQQAEHMPENLRWLNDMSAQQNQNTAGMRMMMPKEATLAFEPGPDGDPDFVLGLNLRMMARPLRMLMTWAAKQEGQLLDYRGRKIIVDNDDDVVISFADNTMIISGSREALERALDRVIDGPPPGATPGLYRAIIPEGNWDITGGFDNTDGRFDGFLLTEVDDDIRSLPGVQNASAIGFGIDIETSDRFSGTMAVQPPAGADFDAWQAEVEANWHDVIVDAAEDGLDLQITTSREGNLLVSRLVAEGLDQVIDNWLLEDLYSDANWEVEWETEDAAEQPAYPDEPR
ncbi:MAG: hypothetical protein AAGD38_04265 [Acidobacteriota bacterium]